MLVPPDLLHLAEYECCSSNAYFHFFFTVAIMWYIAAQIAKLVDHFHCRPIWQWIKRYDCKNICNFDSVRNKRGINVRCWTSWFDKLWWWCHMLGKCMSGIRISKILLGEDPDPRIGFATSVLAGSGSARHGLPPKQKILATPLAACVKRLLNLLIAEQC